MSGAVKPEKAYVMNEPNSLWAVTEGYNGSTNPATGGRAVFFVDQASVD